MDATFNSEQESLRAAIRNVAGDRFSGAARRALVASGAAYDDGLWSLLAGEMGSAGVGVPEAMDGYGGDFTDVAVVLEECGRGLLPVPLLGTCVAAACLSSVAAPGDEVRAAIARIATGQAAATVVPAPDLSCAGEELTGVAAHVLDGHRAELLLLATLDGLWLLEASTEGVQVQPEWPLDVTRGQATVRCHAATGQRLGDASASERAVDLLRIGLALDGLGVARACLAMTVDYLKTREQFGRPIGSFQALQHRAAELAVAVESAASAAYYAAWAAADAPEELPVVAPLALSVSADAAYRCAAENIQLHGGIGFTWEHDAHLYFKRATSIRLALGDGHVQRSLVAARAGIA